MSICEQRWGQKEPFCKGLVVSFGKATLIACIVVAFSACDSSLPGTNIATTTPGVASISVSSVVDNQATVDWNLTSSSLVEQWRLYQNDLLVCSGEPLAAVSSADNSSYQTGSCSVILKVGSNSFYVQLCNSGSGSSSLCSQSATEIIDYQEQTELGAISWQDFPSSSTTSENELYLSWSKEEGVNGDYWHIYQNDAPACSGVLDYSETFGGQSGGCNVTLALGANDFRAQLCQTQPVGIADNCVQSPVAIITFDADPQRILATAVIVELDESLPAGYDISISWSKDTSNGSAGEDWSLFNNGIALCQGVITSADFGASCLTQLSEGDNQLQVRLCTDAATYSGASCAYSATVAVEGFDPEPLAPGTLSITSSIPAQVTDAPSLIVDWEIASGNGVSSWSVAANAEQYCYNVDLEQYYWGGSCQIALEVGVNSISVTGCNYGYDNSESCSTSLEVSTEYIVIPGTPELTSSFPASTYLSEHNLSWELVDGEAADYWLAVVNDTSKCSGDLLGQMPQSGSCMVELDSGVNAVVARLCIGNESGSAYCSDSAAAQVELLASIPAQPEIGTSEQTIADDTILLEWSKSSGDNGSYWSVDNSGESVSACSGQPIRSSGSSQSGDCYLPLALGANLVSVHLCNNNAAGTASCSTSESITISRVSAAPEFTSATSASVAENNNALFYTASVSDNDSLIEQISFSLSGADSYLFSIDSSGGLAFSNSADYESPQDINRDNIYQLSLTATDETELYDQLELSVSVSNVNDIAPEFTSAAFVSVAENTIGVIHTIQASDVEGDSLSYALAGADFSHFSLDSSSGELAIIAPLDYESPLDATSANSYELEINASDGINSTIQAFTVNLSDLNDETPQATSPQSLALELSSISLGVTIYTVTASDADAGDQLSYSHSGADASHFSLDSRSGDLRFIVLPSGAASEPIDANGDSVYELNISVRDLALNSSSFELSIAVADDVGHYPQFDTAQASATIAENSSASFYTALAVDPEGEGVSYGLSGVDSSHFVIDSSSGVLSPLAPLDYEKPLDSGSDNNYSLTILASDPLGNQSQQALDVLVSNVNDNAPSFSADSASVTVAENIATSVYSASGSASDADGDSLTYSLTGTDAGYFTIDPSSGALAFAIVADYENPQDYNRDNTYDVIVIASDASTSANQSLSVTVEDSNDNSPSFGFAADLVSVLENGALYVYTARATDADSGDQVVYALAGTDASYFVLDPSSGALNSISPFDYEYPLDANADNSYELELIASDGTNDSALALSVIVSNINDNFPSFALESDSVSIAENSSGTIYTAVATDLDGGTSLSYSLLGVDASAFVIDSVSGALSFVNAPDFDNPADSNRDNHYELEIRASDGSYSASLNLAVVVTDLNDIAPLFASSADSVEFLENSTSIVYTANATDADGDSVAYSLEGNDVNYFSIDAASGALSFRNPPDFENPGDQDRDNHYQLDIAASDGVNSSSLALTVALQDANDNSPSFAIAAESIPVPENSSGTIYTAAATDPDAIDSLSYSLSGTDSYQFSINATSGALAFLSPPDFEKPTDQGLDNHYQLNIEASDGSNSASLAFTVEISDSNDNSPSFAASADTLDVAENSTGIIYTAAASDADISDAIIYSLAGSDASHFTIGAASGALAFRNPPDFDQPSDQGGNNSYQIDIEASDGSNSASLALTVAVTNLNDNSPSFAAASAAIQVAENSSGTIYTAQATDLDAADSLSYSLSGGDDYYQFSINSTSGALSFFSSPDFEQPADQNSDNHYQLEIEASDGANSSRLALTVEVTNLNDNSPSFARESDALSVAENTTATVYTASATDLDGDILSYSLSGADAQYFALDSSSGVLAFLAAPDFDQPTDQNGDNRYQLEIRASDGANSITLRLEVAVSDLNDELPQVTSVASVVLDFSSIVLNATIYTVTATDLDSGDQLSYALGGADAQHFSLDSSSGALALTQQPSLSTPQDADGNNRYDLQITVSDLGGNSTLFDLEVRVADDIGSPPAFASASASVEFAENSTSIVYTAAATDIDNETLTYSISGTDATLFTIGASSGLLAFRSAPDYEQPADANGDNSYSLNLIATDPVGNQGQQSLTVQVSNTNDNAPVFNQSSSTIDFTENDTSSIALSASDVDGDTLSYSLAGTDALAFNIDTSSGTIWFARAPDYDQPHDSNQDNVYEFVFSASDGAQTSSQNIAISISNLNDEFPQVTSPASLTIDFSAISLNAPVYTLTATDLDPGDQVSYVLGGADAGHFYLNAASGELSFGQQPSLSAPLDADGDNVYDLQITALDSAMNSTLFDLAITVVDDIGSPPAFSSASASVEFAENGTGIVYTAQATDVDGEVLVYSLGGADAALFTLNSSSGDLSFRNPPDYEQPQDVNSDNSYSLTFTATDPVGNQGQQSLAVQVGNVNDNAPLFNLSASTIAFLENNTSALDLGASDADGDALSYYLSGADAGAFNLDSGAGTVGFKSTPDYEQPHDGNRDNAYDIELSVSDGAYTASQSFSIAVGNANDNAPIFNISVSTLTIAENDTSIIDASASDADGDALAYSLSGSDAGAFSIDEGSGALAFLLAPDYENPRDRDRDNLYELVLNASDGSQVATHDLNISVSNISDSVPSFASNSDSITVTEHSSGVIYSAQASDPDGDSLSYGLGGADVAAFTIDAASGALAFASDPDFESPSDQNSDNTYELSISASDGTSSASLALTVQVEDINDNSPRFAQSSESLAVAENSSGTIYTATATDLDAGSVLSYSLSGADSSPLQIDASSGALAFRSSPDYEAPQDSNQDNLYQIVVEASDGVNTGSQDLAISVSDSNDEAPQFTSLGSQAVNYTAVQVGDIIYTAQAVDLDAGDQITYALTGADASSFSFDATSGALAFAQLPSLAEFQSSNGGIAYALTITATDLASNSSVLDLTINLVDDTGSAPEFTQASANVTVDENVVGFIYQAAASDADGDPIAYSLEGTDAAAFIIDSSSGELRFTSPPDYEQALDAGANNVYEFSIIATDSPVGNQAQQSLNITVTNLNDNPPIFSHATTSAISVEENTPASTTIYDANASDADGATITYTISGDDAALFAIASTSGVLSFKQAPDYEDRQDANQDNVYELSLEASDGETSASVALQITVTDVNEAPVLSANISWSKVEENYAQDIYQVSATDPDYDTLTFAIIGGADANTLELTNTKYGYIRFISPPNYEQPDDADQNSIYHYSVSVSDGVHTVTEDFELEVYDINDAPSFASSSAARLTAENNTSFVYQLDISDEDQDPLNYSLSGADSAEFSLDFTTLELSFNSAPDYEGPQDSDQDNVYELSVTAADAEYSDSQAITISVSDLNDEVPQFTSASSLALDFTSIVVGATIYTAASSDADAGDSVTYGLSGADEQHFSFNTSSGALAFAQAPSLSAPQDADGDNVYQITITATDSANNSSQLALSVSVLDDIGKPPEFTQTSASITVDENSAGVVYQEPASDPDGDTVVYSIEGVDSGFFGINSSSAALSFISAPDYEQPEDSGLDNTYELSIIATDPVGNQGQQSLAIAINNLNDNAPQFNLSSTTFSITEGETSVVTITAQDADGDDLSYDLEASADVAYFSLDPSSGTLALQSAADFENPQDSDQDNNYQVSLSAFDGSQRTSIDLQVTVTDINDYPVFSPSQITLSVNENDTSVIHNFQASDQDNDPLTYVISPYDHDAQYLSVDTTSGAMSFISAADYEQPLDSNQDNQYYFYVSAYDSSGVFDNQDVYLNVVNVNEAPAFASTSVSLSVAENDSSFTHVVEAAIDPDADEILSYQLGGTDQSAFNFDPDTRELSFKANPDYELPADHDGDNLYQIDITATDSDYSTTQAITISVSNSNDELPQFTSASSQSIEFTTIVVGTTIYTVTTSDADSGDQATYTLSGADASHFSLDATSGALAFTQSPSLDSPRDADNNNIYELTITATDQGNNSNQLALSVVVTDAIGKPPAFAELDVSLSVDEGSSGVIYTATASDPDGDSLVYAISGTDSAQFSIDPSSGALSFVLAPDYEQPADDGGNNIYQLSVSAEDPVGNQGLQSLEISITNLNDNSPQFDLTANSFTIAENTSAVANLAASDADGDPLTFSLVASDDSSLFSLDPDSGALAFISAPDFETAQDSNTDNTYELELSVFDGSHTTTQEITITVTDVNEAPSFPAATLALSVDENNAAVFYTADASDPENDSLTFSISGADQSDFEIDSYDGELQFDHQPDYEAPRNTNNTYYVSVSASDGEYSASVDLTVTVVDVNEAPEYAQGASQSLQTDENSAAAIGVDVATDPEQDSLVHSISGDDAGAFSINSVSGNLTYLAPLDYEQPQDFDGDNSYEFSVSASDGQYTTSLDVTLQITDIDDASPQFTSASSQTVDYTSAQVGAIIYTVSATDPDSDDDQISYALSGIDSSHFSFNTSSGELAFAQAPSLESPQDDNGDNSYELVITATDPVSNSDDLDLSIKVVDDTGSAPTFTQASASINVDENSASTIYTAQATDADPGDNLSYSISGTDFSLFAIEPSSGELAFNTAPDFESPSDNGKDNTYDLAITATDTIGKQASQDLAITILNLNDNPPQFVLSANSFDVAENTTAITTVAANDVDGDDLTFSLTNSTDASFFSLDSSSGVLAFTSAPDFETAQDSNTDNTYELELSVFDGAHTTTQSISVKVTNVDEAPSFTATNQNPSVSENTSGSFYTASASDPEQATLTYSTNGADAGLFDLDSASGELAFKTPPDYESPADQGADNTYQLTITVSDGANQVSQSLAITVTNVNEAPAFASASVNLNTDENDASFTHIVEAATDPDQGETLTYQLSGDDANDFNFDTSTRSLSFANTPDFENPADQGANNVYQVTITAADAEYSASQDITIAVADLNDETPQFTSASSLVLDYTSVAVDTIIYTVQATDADAGDQITYTLSGTDQQHFSFAASSGELAFSELPSLENPKDADNDNVYQLSIAATDLGANSTDLALSISVVDDTGSAPTFTQVSVSINVDENSASSVYTAQASDVDPGDTLTYSIAGIDADLFTIDPSSGELAFNTAPDYENPSDSGADNTYELSITANDTIGKQASQDLTITILNLNDNTPQFDLSANSFDVAENTTAITTVAANDVDGDDLTFSLTNSTDASFFSLDSTNGALTFASAPDFETAQDSNSDNTYELELSVFDGAHTTTQSISVKVTNVDEAPSFTATNQNPSVSENTSGSFYTASASDPEQATLTYSTNGADAGLFDLDSASGELAFKTPPDYESPADQGADNTYQLTITVSDGANQVSQSLAITVTNVNEAPAFASASVNLNTDENDASFTHIVEAATDPDQGETLTYQLSGDDAADFNFDASTRVLSFKATPDFENPADQNTNNAYQIDIIASDGDLEATQAITITVTNVEESPYFHSTTDHVEITEDPATEGTASPVLALSIQAADDEDDFAGTSLNFVISGGADSDKFSLTAIGANSANLSFIASPDFDNPHDSNLDSNYSLTIEVADSSGDQAQHDLIVQVLGVNDETPQLSSSANADVNENSTAVFYIATATDADRSDWSDPDSSKHYQPNLDSITFSLDTTSYPDSSLFSINSSSGELQATSGLDYENPLSSAQSNYYTVGIEVADSAANSSVNVITVTVIDDPDEPEPVASSGPQIPWFYSDVSVGESIDIPWVIYSGDGAISWSMLVNGTTVCSESASISAPATSGVCSVSSSYLKSGTNLNTAAVSVTYSDGSSELSEEVSFAYAVSATTSRYPTPTASVSDGIAACQNVDIGDEVSATSNTDCWNFLLGNDDFGGPYDEVPSYLTTNYGRGFDVIAYYGDWSIYDRNFQPADMPVNLLSTALYSFIMLDGDIPATQAANADEKECEDCSFSGAVDFADYYSAIHKAYSLPDDPLATDKWLGTEGVGDGYVAYGSGIGEHWTDDSAYKGNGIFKQFWLLKQKFPHFKTCISVGGWSFSRPFPLIASDSTKLATFVESITDMAVKYHFDCIDIDWEFPGKAGGDYVNNNSAVVYDYDGDGKTPFITPTAADAGYFVNLISALRAELDSRSEASHIEINSAVYTSEDGMALMDYNAFAGNLDGIHMMTYDYYGAWDAHTGLQAALYANSDPVHSEVSVLHGDVYNNKHNIASAMARAVNNAIDNGFGSNHDIRRKIVPGLAFYGRNYSGVSTTPVPGKYMVLANSAAEQLSWEQGNLNYIQIEGYYEDGATMSGNSAYDAGGYSTAGRSWTYRWDSESMAPFLYDASTGSFIGYTDPRAIFYQTCHAARENSKGVMFWEMTQESADFHLVQAIHTAIRGDTMTQYADQPHCDDIIDRDTTSNNDDDDNGGDTGGGNDDDGGDTGGGDTGGDTSSGTSGLQELEDLGYFTETVFNSLFYNTTLNQGSSTDGACTGYSFFNNWLDLKEAATYYPDFAAEGSMEDRLRELAAFLANTSHETTGAWQTYALDPALGARYHYGYCFKEEVGCENQTSCTQYCDSANTEYGYACSLGTTYHGRGPIQFTWNYNYGPMSEVLYGNNNYTLLENPSILVTDAVISYRSALWFWMTVQAPKPSAHDVMIGNYSAEASKNRYPGFGMTINIINGGLECGTDDFAEAKNKNRLGFYLAYLKVLGDAYGSDIAPWVTESSTSTTYGATPANYSAFDLNEADLISRYSDVETYLSCKNMEHY